MKTQFTQFQFDPSRFNDQIFLKLGCTQTNELLTQPFLPGYDINDIQKIQTLSVCLCLSVSALLKIILQNF